MLFKHLQYFIHPQSACNLRFWRCGPNRFYSTTGPCLQTVKQFEYDNNENNKLSVKCDTVSFPVAEDSEQVMPQVIPTTRAVPMLMNKESTVLSFDEVPGPKTLKFLSNIRNYVSEIGTLLTAGFFIHGLSVGNFIVRKKPVTFSTRLFDHYGPVVRFISPLGGDIVLTNNPVNIEKIFSFEGKYPVRSSLDSLDKYRKEHRSHAYGGLYSVHGEEWNRRRSLLSTPLNNALNLHSQGIYDVSEAFSQKVYNVRNHQDEVPSDLYKELHKWAFDCIALLIFSKKFEILDTEVVYNQSEMMSLYNNLEKATKAIMKCESGVHIWKRFATPAWYSLVKHCDNVDNLIVNHVIEVNRSLSLMNRNRLNSEETLLSHDEQSFPDYPGDESLISTMLAGQMTPEDIVTVLMDLMIIGVNTVATSMSFLLYNLAKHQKCQKILYQEIRTTLSDFDVVLKDIYRIKNDTPYLQACIKETLRLVPPIPVLTRVLPKNITLDKYNIPRGTLIVMSTRDASLKEGNYDDAAKFNPERWLKPDAADYHAFASIPFGFGVRKCLGQNIAETMLSVLTMKLLQKYHLEYHYGDIEPTRTFICKPNKAVKIRFIDRY